jgi:AraC-like DNA-binding protein
MTVKLITNKKKYVVVIAISLFTLTFGVRAIDYGKLYKSTEYATLQQLNKKSKQLMRDGRKDSAMAVLSVICNRYDKSMDDMDKDLCARAFNNSGLICFYSYNYYLAYSDYLKALDIANTIHDEAIIPGICINIGNVYENYDDKENAIRQYKKAFDSAMATKNWDPMAIAFVSIMTTSISSDRFLSGVGEVLQAYNKLDDQVKRLSPFTQHIYEGMKSICDRRDYVAAVAEFDSAARKLDFNIAPERNYGSAMYLKASAYERAGRFDMAEDVVENTIAFLKGKGANDMVCSLYESLAYYASKNGDVAKARDSKFRFYQLEHEMFSARKFGKIHEMKSIYEMKNKDEQMSALRTQKRIQMVVLDVVSISSVIIIGLLVILYMKSRRQQQLFRDLYRKNLEAMEQTNAEKIHYRTTNLDDMDKRELLERVEKVMADSQEIFGAEFSIDRLAELVDTKPRNISLVINGLKGKNFNALLGEYRVKEACRRLADDETYGNLSIEGIATGLGFKSRSNFVNVFKKVTGLTPSEFHKMSKRR